MHEDIAILRKALYRSGLSVENFADDIGISRRQLDRYLSATEDAVPPKRVLNSALWVAENSRKKRA